MAKIGLIAGGGDLPVEFARSVKAKGDKVVVFALKDMASPDLEGIADRLYWLEISEYKKFAFLLLKEMVREIVMLGKVPKNIIYKGGPRDREYVKALKGMKNKKDYSILEDITRRLGYIRIKVVDATGYLSHLMPDKGAVTSGETSARVMEDIEFGYGVARELARMDIGQTVIVKDKAVVAVEAMEGTDSTIKRAVSLAGEGCVMVKVGRPDQDMRWDVPAVGPETMILLIEGKFSALAMESGKMYLVEKDRVVELAEKNGITVTVL